MVIALVPGSIVPKFKFTLGEVALIMHPEAGQAATASATPPGKRSAKSVFARFCILTAPFESVICESIKDVAVENFGTLFSDPITAGITEEGCATTDAAAACAELADVVSTVAAPSTAVGAVIFAKADAGKPPNVCASAASSAYGTLTIRTLGSSSEPGDNA